MTTENGGMFNMPVMPAGYGGNDGFGFGNGWWIIILLIIFGGWGNNGWNGGNNGSDIQRGFDQSALTNGINGIQTSMLNGFNSLQSSMQNCCCENRLATAGLNSTIAQDGSLTRQAMAQGFQGIQDKLCQLELDGIRQNYENRISGMQNALDQARSENQSLRFAASQGAQTAQILANNEAQTTALEQYLAPVPRPAYVVQNPNCCANNFGYGGCGGYAG